MDTKNGTQPQIYADDGESATINREWTRINAKIEVTSLPKERLERATAEASFGERQPKNPVLGRNTKPQGA
ncbi:MAG: hypothetical protein JOZ08_19755 [Verrucomicrobia bacterium]|nr:hypothetical protein [Verrucomicrobiota bacterium]